MVDKCRNPLDIFRLIKDDDPVFCLDKIYEDVVDATMNKLSWSGNQKNKPGSKIEHGNAIQSDFSPYYRSL